ncbi:MULTISPECIES: AbrB/MazE/SpoVT family DNA-binding domain-containing protein [Sporomusa]|jgi:bifunctional DNA-binding transcriptional regulator/antitoxin component of YhaV-PrlF toxin-antitoxin module|uniref:AbrB/MazE/SpoVT family DNA-binding domain-containing protein n=1 Tax=Sporomusa TaxID=2375 RepID=UPI00166C9995|nr:MULTISPECIES: AbrB/MazE/SpoVT family DNA-binding domain-containing protein [Sporomusa]MCM0760786.1 AbrB/MazE/SpoVT family DNA-binding domain-containing protein [Sporomusa sphaeroides DSM 2875]HML32238.1 AbrB/MazE/SpoVT family DNA-binding domain-containing protein [Sporomusa sphaeroides]
MLAKMMERGHVDRKIISVSQKRQITIPLKFFKQLGLETEVECFIQDDALVIRRLRNGHENFSVEILKDLIARGVSGENLVRQFEQETKNIRTAIGIMTSEAERIAAGESPAASFDDVFSEDK